MSVPVRTRLIAGGPRGGYSPGAVIRVGIRRTAPLGPGIGAGCGFSAVSEVIERVAFGSTRAGELIGRYAADRLSGDAGVPVSFGVVGL